MNPLFGLSFAYVPQPMTPPPVFGGGQAPPYMPPAPYPPTMQIQPLPPTQIQPAYYPSPRRNIPKRPLAAMVLAIVAVVMICISLATPWYLLKMDMSMDSGLGTSASVVVDSKYDFEGVKATVAMDFMGMAISQTCSTSWDSENMKNNTATKSVFKTTQVMDILATVTTILLLAGSVLIILQPGRKMLAVIFGMAAIIMCLLGPLYFAAFMPAAQKSDQGNSLETTSLIPGMSNFTTGDGPWKSFSGSSNTPVNTSGVDVPIKMSWGPDLGWYLGWVGFAMTVAAFALVLTTKRQSPQQDQYGSSPQYVQPQSQYYTPPNPGYPQPPLQQYPAQQYPEPAPYAPAPQYPGAAPYEPGQPPRQAPFQPDMPPQPPYQP